MKREKTTEKSSIEHEKRLRDAILRQIEEENEMIDDHGPVIIGGRGGKPVLPKEEEAEKE